MEALIIFSIILTLGACNVIKYDFDFKHGDDKGTSYQTLHIEHFHPVPTFTKKENKKLVQQPLPAGKTDSKVEINHGDKDDPGYAIQSSSDDSHIFKADDDSPSEFTEFESPHDQEQEHDQEDNNEDGGYQVHEDYHQQQPYYPQEQHHYQYIPQDPHYYYPQESVQHASFHHQPIVVADHQEKS